MPEGVSRVPSDANLLALYRPAPHILRMNPVTRLNTALEGRYRIEREMDQGGGPGETK